MVPYLTNDFHLVYDFRIASLADDIIRTADDRLKLYMRHEKYSADSSVSEALQKLLEGAQATVKSVL